MKAVVQRLSEAEVKQQFPIEGKIEGWFFRVEEVSAGAWVVDGADLFGRKISKSGGDPDSLLAACIADATTILRREEKA